MGIGGVSAWALSLQDTRSTSSSQTPSLKCHKNPYQCIFLKKSYCPCILLFLVKECRREVLLSHCKTGGSLFCLFGLDSFIIFLFLVIQKYKSVVLSTDWSLTGVIFFGEDWWIGFCPNLLELPPPPQGGLGNTIFSTTGALVVITV